MFSISMRAALIALAGVALLAATPWAQAQEPFYKGKRLNLLINFAAGGPADIEGRLFAKHLSRHIDGAPGIIVLNKDGAGGLVGTNYLGELGPRDGTMAGYLTASAWNYVIDPRAYTVDFGTYEFIAYEPVNVVYYMRTDALPAKDTAGLLQAKGLVAGGLSADSSKDILIRLALDMLGVPFKYVTGFRSSAPARLALQRNEINFFSEPCWDGMREGRRSSMSNTKSEIDFFISRRGATADVAQEAATVLKEEGYTVLVQDYDIAYASDFIAAIDSALKRCRHLILLLTRDYTASEYTMMEVTNFLAAAARIADERRLVILRLDETTPEGILASRVYGDLVGVDDPQERKRRILAAAEGRSTATQRRHKLFENVAPRDLNFAGRDETLAELHRVLRASDGTPAIPCAAIHGLGGMGKSSLAAEYTHRFAGDYSGVWWAAAEQRALLTASLAALAGKLDPRLAGEPDQEKAAKAGLARLAGFATPFLLIYDNVENPESLRELLPLSGARVVVTTRWADWAGRAAEIKLDLLSEAAAAQFLQTRAGRQDAPGAARLAKALGCLPLALDHAGAYCRLAGASMSFDAYRNKIDARIARAPKGYPDSVARTFSLAIEKAAVEQPAAEKLLGFLAFLAPERIPLDLISEEILDEHDRTDALIALSAVSLVEHQTLEDDAAGVALHRLVQAAMRAQLSSQQRLGPLLGEVLHCLAEAVPEGAYGEPRHWARCAQLLPHVLALRDHAATAKLECSDLAQLNDRIGEFLYARGSLDLSKTFFSEAIAIGKNAFGARHVAVAKAMNNLANVLQDIGPNPEAEALLRDALDIQMQQSGTAHPSYARTLTSLARVLQDSGRQDEAEAKLREAIALGEQTLGRAHPDVTARLNNLAMLMFAKGQLSEAEALFREAIELGEKSLGRDHPQVLGRLSNFAFILQHNGKLDEAKSLYREAIASGEKAFGPDHRHPAIWLQNLANLLRDSGRTAEAERHYMRALEILLLNLGADHTHTARVRSNFAKLYLAMDRPDQAHDLAQAAVAVHAKLLGDDHPWTQESRAVVQAASQARQPPRPATSGESAASVNSAATPAA